MFDTSVESLINDIFSNEEEASVKTYITVTAETKSEVKSALKELIAALDKHEKLSDSGKELVGKDVGEGFVFSSTHLKDSDIISKITEGFDGWVKNVEEDGEFHFLDFGINDDNPSESAESLIFKLFA